jgi:hypothetical protein
MYGQYRHMPDCRVLEVDAVEGCGVCTIYPDRPRRNIEALS